MASTSKSSSGRQRHFYDEVQLELLDTEFARDSYPNREGRRRIAQLIGVSEKSIMVGNFNFNLLYLKSFLFFLFQCWFQNRRRRARQLGSSRAVASTRQTIRQHRRVSPYVSPRPQQGKKSIEKV